MIILNIFFSIIWGSVEYCWCSPSFSSSSPSVSQDSPAKPPARPTLQWSMWHWTR